MSLRVILLVAVCLTSVVLAQPQQHVVAPGETLYAIAQRYNTSVDALLSVNALGDANLLSVGQVLLIPGTGAAITPIDPTAAPHAAAYVALQGEVLTLNFPPVTLEDNPTQESPVPSRARFLDIDYDLLPTAEGASLIVAVPVLQEPGVYALELFYDGEGSEAEPTLVSVSVTAGPYAQESITLPPESNALMQRELIANELEFVRSRCRTFEAARYWQGVFRYPLDETTITSDFGTRRSYNGGPFTSYHEGVDFRGNSATPVYAAAAGRAVIAETLTVRGNSVYVQHGQGVCSGYTHLDRLVVEPGQVVTQGELLGYVGATGLVTGPHLHWEVRLRGIPVNPHQWVREPVGEIAEVE